MKQFFYDNEISTQVIEEGKITRKIKAHGGNLMLVEVFCENEAIGTSHKHIHEQATYCLDGKFEFIIGDETKVVKTGDTLFIPSNIEHNFKLLSKTGKLLDIFTPQRLDFLEN